MQGALAVAEIDAPAQEQEKNVKECVSA